MPNRILLGALVLAAVGVGAGFGSAPPAAAATPCWRLVVDDWFTGRVESTYAPHCYSDALRHLPADARAYTTAAGDIERALLAAVAARRTPSAPTAPPVSSRRLQSVQAPERTRMGARRSDPPAARDETIFERAAAVGSSGRAATVPLPILVLATVAALLLAAAGTSRLTRGLRGLRRRT